MMAQETTITVEDVTLARRAAEYRRYLKDSNDTEWPYNADPAGSDDGETALADGQTKDVLPPHVREPLERGLALLESYKLKIGDRTTIQRAATEIETPDRVGPLVWWPAGYVATSEAWRPVWLVKR